MDAKAGDDKKLTEERRFPEPLHVGRPNIGDRARLHELLDEILDRRWLTNFGPVSMEFERQIAARTAARHAVAVCNATIALQVVMKALGLRGEVIVPAFTFVATPHSVLWEGLTPVFCDVDAESHALDPERVEELITPRTCAILAVHLWCRPAFPARLADIARRHGLKLIFDAAHAFAGRSEGRPIGTFGDAEVFSFHATKFVNAFEGGAITTQDSDLERRIRLAINFGFAGYDNVVDLGTNGKMSEISAAMGLVSLDALDDIVALNRRNWERYREGLAGIPGLKFFRHEPDESNFQYVVLEVDEEAAGVTRDALCEHLWQRNVRARRYFAPGCHLMQPYRTLYPGIGSRLPVTERLAKSCLTLPGGATVTEAEVDLVCELMREGIPSARGL